MQELLPALLEVSLDLTRDLPAHDRFQRLLAAAEKAIGFDAACLMRLEGGELVPLASWGLDAGIMRGRFDRLEHPRLDIILRSASTVRFRPDAPLPDPFDGHLKQKDGSDARIHACLGCAVRDAGVVIGALCIDALDAHAFDALDDRAVTALAALAGAAMRMDSLFQEVQRRDQRREAVVQELQRNVDESLGGAMIGTSPPMQKLVDDIDVVAASSFPVLITGETGVGKELVARRIHSRSSRSDAPMIQVNCAALPASIAESELFGHVQGAFTDARNDRLGKFEVAHGGTLFLDEVGELPIGIQGKLLRVLQNGEVQRVGSDKLVRVDVRLIAATNRDIGAEVKAGRFRADLYHRLAVFPIHVAPLRERVEDVPLLAAHFLARARQRLGLGPVRLSEDASQRLRTESWLGNVRELENVVSRGVLRASRRPITREAVVVEVSDLDLAGDGMATTSSPTTAPRAAVRTAAVSSTMRFKDRCDVCKREQIREALERHHGRWAAVAREMGMNRSNLHRLATRLGLRAMED